MPSITGPHTAAPAGSTGNNNHAGVGMTADADSLALDFEITAVGATPTVTFKVQGTLDGTNWFDMLTMPSDSNTAAVTQVKTAVGHTIVYIAQLGGAERFAAQVRLATSANTNVTYKASFYFTDEE